MGVEKGVLEWVLPGPPRIRLLFVLSEAGRMECCGMEMTDEDAGITTADVRRVRLASLVDEALEGLAPDIDQLLEGREPPVTEAELMKVRPAQRARYAAVAEVYRKAWRRGSRRPDEAVAKHFGMTMYAASMCVFRCRSAGLLPSTTQGAHK